MNIPRATTLSSSVLHLCGKYLEFRIEVNGEAATATLQENRFTFTSYFAKATIYFKAHGTRVVFCPECGMALPRTIEEWDDREFQQGEKKG